MAVPLLHRRFEDPPNSRDSRIRDLVAALENVERPAPGAAFRAELRAQLVAVTPRVVAEEAEAATKVATAKPVATAHRSFSLKRPLLIAATMITVAAMILGGAVWMSQKAIPGDTLYGLKRASERFELSLDGSDKERADDYLRFAGRRVDESRQLLARTSAYGGGNQAAAVSPETAKLIDSALSAGDSDVLSANALLNRVTQRSNSGDALTTLIGWAPGQLDKLVHLRSASPTDALQARALSSWTLVRDSLVQAKALQALRSGTQGGTLPGGGTNGGTNGSKKSTTSRSPNGTGTGTVHRPGGSATTGGTTTGPQPGTSSSTPGGILPTLPVKLPTTTLPLPTSLLPSNVLPTKLPAQLPTKLPTKLPTVLPTKLPTKLPVPVGSSCVSVPVVGVGVGNC